MKKLKSIWTLLWAKHYAVLKGDSDAEIAWAIQTLKTADEIFPKINGSALNIGDSDD